MSILRFFDPEKKDQKTCIQARRIFLTGLTGCPGFKKNESFYPVHLINPV
jgi:hypothetical protein